MEVEPMVRYQDPKLMRHEQRSYVRQMLNSLMSDIDVCLDNVTGETQIAESGEELICQELSDDETMYAQLSNDECLLIAELKQRVEALEKENEKLRELCQQLTPAVKPKRKVKR